MKRDSSCSPKKKIGAAVLGSGTHGRETAKLQAPGGAACSDEGARSSKIASAIQRAPLGVAYALNEAGDWIDRLAQRREGYVKRIIRPPHRLPMGAIDRLRLLEKSQ
jgi:hypothetical protein